VQLAPLDHLFDFRDEIPRDSELEPWEGEIAINPWAFQGTETESTAVTLPVDKPYTSFASSTGTAYYDISAADGARLSGNDKIQTSMTFAIPATATVDASNRDQWSLVIDDGTRKIQWGVIYKSATSYYIGFFGSSGWLGDQYIADADDFQEITVIRNGDNVELWANGKKITTVAYSSFDAGANHKVTFGIQTTAASLEVYCKQLGAGWAAQNNYWCATGDAGSVVSANPKQFVDGATLLDSQDVGSQIIVSGGTTTNTQGGMNNGVYLVDSIVSTGTAELVGETFTERATIDSSVQITIEGRSLTYPDDLGKSIVISDSELVNDGTYTITKLIEEGTGTDFASYSTDCAGAKTHVCEVSGSLTPEQKLTYRIDPAFVTETGLDWELSDAGSVSGDTLTLRQGLWINDLVMQGNYPMVLSGQLVDSDTQNQSTGTAYSYYPFYLANSFGLMAAYISDLTAAGVIPVYEDL